MADRRAGRAGAGRHRGRPGMSGGPTPGGAAGPRTTKAALPASAATAAAADRARLARPVPLGRRSAGTLLLISAIGLVAFGWPLLAATDSALVGHAADAPWLFALLLPLLLAVVVAQISEGRSADGEPGLDAKSVALLGMLAAAGAALRPLGAGTAGLEPMFFLMVLSGRVLGPGFGFVLGSVSMFASALLTGGVGPWLPFQMLSMGWVCLGAGLLPGPARLRGRRELALLAVYGACSAVGYGTIMNLQGWPYIGGLSSSVSFEAGAPLSENLPRFVAYCLTTSLGWDLPRAALTVVLCLTLGGPVLRTLRRAARRAAFGAPVVFTGAPEDGDHGTTAG
ncbi:ECF transporter S component [Kitasatospora indigofera]